MVRLLLCRHGQTEWNVLHKFQGQQNSDLTEVGKKQVALLGERLREYKIDAVYCSKLQRAIDSARIACEAANITLPITQEAGLNEIFLGKLEGMNFETGNAQYPEVMRAFWDETSGTTERESIGDVMRRAARTIEEIAERHEGQTVFVMTHGVVLRALYVYLRRWDISEAPNQPKPGSACFCDVRKEAGGVWNIYEWVDDKHLASLEDPTPKHSFL